MLESARLGDPDARRGAAAIVAPITEGRRGGAIGEKFPVGRVGAFPADGERNFCGEAARDGDGEEGESAVGEALAWRGEEDIFAVGSPSGDDVRAGVIGDAARRAAAR